MKNILDISQIATGIAAIVSFFFTIYVYRSQRIDKKLTVAMNVSSWNVAMSKARQAELAKETNPNFYNNSNSTEWHNAPNCSNITVNNNPFPVYNLIIVFVPNYFDLKGLKPLSREYQCFYHEVLTPGKTMTDFVNDHTIANGNLVPELYFTDNSNVQWHRSKNGILKETTYMNKAIQLGIIQKHL